MMALIITLAGGVVSEWGVAMLLGANIGTTSTVILAPSWRAGRRGGRP